MVGGAIALVKAASSLFGHQNSSSNSNTSRCPTPRHCPRAVHRVPTAVPGRNDEDPIPAAIETAAPSPPPCVSRCCVDDRLGQPRVADTLAAFGGVRTTAIGGAQPRPSLIAAELPGSWPVPVHPARHPDAIEHTDGDEHDDAGQ